MLTHAPHVKTTFGARPALWKLGLAFTVVYLGYGFNFLAVKVAVETLPPFLFAGSHVLLAGILLGLWRTSRSPRMPCSAQTLVRAAGAAFFLFVGGVGLVTLGEKLGIPSGYAAMIKASVPIWIAILEAARPRGEKPTLLIAGGLLLGATGVAILVVPRLASTHGDGTETLGTLVLLASALLFAIGTLVVRHQPPSADTTTNAVWMMLFGGAFLIILGLLTGEAGLLNRQDFTPEAGMAFCFLLFVHSLAAFSAMNWLLAHLPAPVVATKFYVSPAIATLAGFLVLHEPVTGAAILGLGIILGGVAVVMLGERLRNQPPALRPDDFDELES